jgi:chromosome segregation ATPase
VNRQTSKDHVMPINFLKNLAIVRKDMAVNSALEAIVRWDPRGASLADLRTMEERLDGIGRKSAELKVRYDKEKAEADQAREAYNVRVAAITAMRAKVDAEADPARKEARTAALTAYMNDTRPYMERAKAEIQDEESAKKLLEQVQAAYATAAAKLRDAKTTLERAQRDLASAEQRKADARQREQDAREMAGLETASTGIDVALKALKDATDRSNAEAEVMDRKAELLAPANPEKEDPFVAEALREVQGSKPQPTLDEQLDAFKPL